MPKNLQQDITKKQIIQQDNYELFKKIKIVNIKILNTGKIYNQI